MGMQRKEDDVMTNPFNLREKTAVSETCLVLRVPSPALHLNNLLLYCKWFIKTLYKFTIKAVFE
jgi:hypothetical protein